MSTKIDRIANLLASGMKPSLVARITCVTESYISQLAKDPDFLACLEELKQEKQNTVVNDAEEDKFLQDKFMAAEHRIVDRIIDRVDLMSDGHAIAALRAIGDRHDAMRKHSLMSKIPELQQGQATMRIVELTMPAIAVPELLLGKNNEVVRIGGRNIAPMPTEALQRMIENEAYESL